MLTISLEVGAADLAVVIDDVGYNKVRGMRAISLPGPVTIAVLPFAPHTSSLIQHASLVGKDVIVHQPMQPRPSPQVRDEQDTLTLAMSAEEFDAAISRALDAVPMRVGLSNHTGSLLTQHHLPMARLMSQLQERGLFFLDSRTSAETVALQVAHDSGVPALKRDVFLDHDRSPHAIDRAFQQALTIARRNGHAVLIGHPYTVSLEFLEDRLRELPADIELVNAADLAKRGRQPPYPTILAQPPGLSSLRISPGR